MTTSSSTHGEALARTALHGLHAARGARLVPFAGYEMPVQYEGILAEHLHVRAAAGLFDVSHMGQASLFGPGDETVARALEALMPGDFLGLKPGFIRYSMLLSDAGGIYDDLMVTRGRGEPGEGRYLLVVNAARKSFDLAHIEAALPKGVTLVREEERALIALQGPKAAAVMEAGGFAAAPMVFMTARRGSVHGVPVSVSRSGYTGEDGFEISVPVGEATRLAEALLAHPDVKPIGLGARDSLRLEAGLCLYGSDIDETTSPVEAGLTFALSKRRREAGDFPGAARILKELEEGPARLRVGILPDGPAPARAHTEIRGEDGAPLGEVTSGGYAPSLSRPIAMGYVARGAAADGTPLALMVRDRARAAHVAPMPFVPHRYRR
ncbi:MAG: glycine cleavage system aminomethyltransferase GcvT [Alphaproteobacteria bacterium]|nr:glycine cleavage system aminomethyltransferase GcvT [Alphaproteobacteria bacterium]